jgi:hypothetical protein
MCNLLLKLGLEMHEHAKNKVSKLQTEKCTDLKNENNSIVHDLTTFWDFFRDVIAGNNL